MFLRINKLFLTLLLSLAFVNLLASEANAFKFVFKRVGEWDQMFFNPFTGNKIGTVSVPHFRLEQVEIEPITGNTGKLLLSPGTSADDFLTSLGGGVVPVTMDGQSIAFDNTMFPDIPGSGFTTDTNNGTEFLITLDEPLTEPVGTVVDVSDMNIIVSTPLDIFDSSLVQGSAFNSTMTDSAPAEIVQVQVPESSVSTVVLLSVVGFGALLRRKCNRFMG